MRVKSDLERINASGGQFFGYVNMTTFNCPPFVMFTNNNDCGICDFQLSGKTFEQHSTRIWSRLVAAATGVVDAGAHSGVYTLIAAAVRSDIPIVSCEPNPDGYARLEVNVNANGVKNVTALRLAVGSKRARVNFAWRPKFAGQISSGGNLQAATRDDLKPGEYQAVVEMTTLDALAAAFPLGDRPAVKIDVEGSELLVFKGMGQVIESRPDIILETFDPVACTLINEMTRARDYKYYRIDDIEHRAIPCAEISPRLRSDPSGYNYLLTARDDIDLT